MNMNSVLGTILWIGLCVYTAYSFPSDADYPSDDDSRQPYPPPVITSPPTNHIVPRDSSITLYCDVKNKDAEGALLWNLNNSTAFLVDGTCYFPELCSYFQLDPKDNATLTIKKVVDQTAGNYFCQFRNASVMHVVHISAVVESVSGPKTIESGDDLHLTCRVTGFPPPHVIWHRQSTAVSPKISMGDSMNLTVPHVSSAHSGVYTCTAINSDGQQSSSRSLNVHVVKGLGAENSIVNAGENFGNTVDLCCIYSSAKREAQIKWLKNEKEVHEVPRYQIKPSKSKSCLSISAIKEEDLGTYTCQFAKEGDGKTPTFAVINLIGIPLTPELLSVLPNEQKTPVVKWKVKTFSPLTSYQIRVKKSEKTEKDWMLHTNKTIVPYSKEEIIEQSLDRLDSGLYDVELVVENKFGSARLVSISAVAVDRHEVYDIHSSPINSSPGNNGASRSIRISLFCILLGVVLSRL